MSMTPERKEEIEFWYRVAEKNVLIKYVHDLLAALEESQQQLESKDETIKLLMFNRNSWEEAEKKAQRELAEAQQTIARQQSALESARNTMEDALSVGEAQYKDFDTRLCPWADLSDGVEKIEVALGNKEGSDKA